MPASPLVVFEKNERGDVLAVSRPHTAVPGKESEVDIAKPEASSLVVSLNVTGSHFGEMTRLTLSVESAATRPPDAVVTGLDEMLAIWYDLPPGIGRLMLESDRVHLDETEVGLRRGVVTEVRAEARQLPSLTVAVTGVPGASDGTTEQYPFQIVSATGDTPIRSDSVTVGTQVKLDYLPASSLKVRFEVEEFQLERAIDLSDGHDASISFELTPIDLHGSVYLGSDLTEASVSFRHKARVKTVRTDERGRYEVRLWQQGLYPIEVTVKGSASGAFSELVDIRTSGQRDFNIPETDVSVHVRDAKDGRPVPKAAINIISRWVDDEGKKGSVFQRAVADESGMATLPPVRPGSVEIVASADGYQPSEPLSTTVADGSPLRLVIDIEAMRRDNSMVVLLPQGAPAEGAELLAFNADGSFLWHGVTPADGSVQVPADTTSGTLIVRHAAAGTAVVPIYGPLPSQIRLPHPAGPLAVKVLRAGGEPGGYANILLWIDGIRLTSSMVNFASWSTSAANGNGEWIGRNLPVASVQIATVTHARFAEARRGTFDSMRSVIPFPWPGAVTVTVVE